MIIRVDYLIYIYMVLCLCMLGFNLYYMGRIRWRGRYRPEKIADWEAIVSSAVSNTENETDTAFFIRKLSGTQQLLIFYEAVQNLLADKKKYDSVMKWLYDNREVFTAIGNIYKKRSFMEQSFYAYIIGEYRLCGNTQEDAIVKQMLLFVIKPSIYCRENALYALYASGEADIVVKAFILMNRHNIQHSRKLIMDGLLEFKGDKKELSEKIWAVWEEFSPYYQVAFIDFTRMISDQFCERYMQILHSETEREVKFAVIRYYRRFYYTDAEKILQNYLNKWNRDDWEFAAISASTLESYPSEKTISALIQGMNSENWYIRDNASDSLIKIASVERLEEILDKIQDSYGKEMLVYKIESRKKMEGHGENEHSDNGLH